MQGKEIVSIQGVTKKYNQFTAVNNLSLHIPTGEVFGFLGPNGAGKSTTLRMLLTLITPTSGTIEVFGKNLHQYRSAILRKVGSIIEKPDFHLYLSAIDNLNIQAKLYGVFPARKELEKLLETVGLKGRGNDKVKTYSHGMKQRLGLAQALIHDPELIILDEPTTGLDPRGIIDLRNLILQLKNERKKTIILSSHILSEIELIADSMTIINKGKAVVQGKVSELLSNEDLIVSIETTDTEKCLSVLNTSLWSNSIKAKTQNVIELHSSKEELPALSKYLAEKNVPVYSLSYKRTLEDYFLKLTNEN